MAYLTRDEAIKYLEAQMERERAPLRERWDELSAACSVAHDVLSGWRFQRARNRLRKVRVAASDAYYACGQAYRDKIHAARALPETALVEVE